MGIAEFIVPNEYAGVACQMDDPLDILLPNRIFVVNFMLPRVTIFYSEARLRPGLGMTRS